MRLGPLRHSPSGKSQAMGRSSALDRQRSTSQSLFLLFLLLGLSGCAGSLSLLEPQRVDSKSDELPAFDHVAVTYFGASGFLLRRGEDAILIDPFFSNPGPLRTLMGRIETRPERVDGLLPAVDDVGAILVSHSHYDHLMDVAHVALHKATRADIYTSRTGTCILGAQFDPSPAQDRLKALGRLKAIGDPPCGPEMSQEVIEPGKWVEVSPRLRFMPLLSEHAPHFRGRSVYEGMYIDPLDKKPTRASDYLKGRVFAFVIELLADRDPAKVDFRIYLQGSASNAGQGVPPAELKDFDLAILAAAGHHEVRGYPRSILKRLEPKHLLVSHWEDFFASPDKPMRLVRGTDVRRFLDMVEEIRAELPDLRPSRLLARGSRAVYPVRGAGN